jgi:hypothetical protein
MNLRVTITIKFEIAVTASALAALLLLLCDMGRGLAFAGPRFLPSFISDCGLGGVLNAARKAASVRRCASWSLY